MSATMIIHIPLQGRKSGNEFVCRDQLTVEQHYAFMGHIIDMSLRRKDDETIPEKPFITTKQMTQEDLVILGSESERRIPDQDFFICRAAQFKKLPDNMETGLKNKAIVAFLRALDPEWFIIIEMSW